ncbi:hypothetical protein M6B38_248135 [Iris pallida]|uniref:Uncharacterized protein n=1 Tax=Iris pallida TaxID=29817 RepID=A0AAX6DGA3_IRIPA|nr:hypothetical protein M6B38_248135 [Iris pallida]
MFIFAHLFATLEREREREERERERGTIFTHTPSSIFLLLFYVTPAALSRKGNFLFIFVKIYEFHFCVGERSFSFKKNLGLVLPKPNEKQIPKQYIVHLDPSMPTKHGHMKTGAKSSRVVSSRVIWCPVYTSTVGCASSCVIYLSYLIGDGWVGNCHGWFSS